MRQMESQMMMRSYEGFLVVATFCSWAPGVGQGDPGEANRHRVRHPPRRDGRHLRAGDRSRNAARQQVEADPRARRARARRADDRPDPRAAREPTRTASSSTAFPRKMAQAEALDEHARRDRPRARRRLRAPGARRRRASSGCSSARSKRAAPTTRRTRSTRGSRSTTARRSRSSSTTARRGTLVRHSRRPVRSTRCSARSRSARAGREVAAVIIRKSAREIELMARGRPRRRRHARAHRPSTSSPA